MENSVNDDVKEEMLRFLYLNGSVIRGEEGKGVVHMPFSPLPTKVKK